MFCNWTFTQRTYKLDRKFIASTDLATLSCSICCWHDSWRFALLLIFMKRHGKRTRGRQAGPITYVTIACEKLDQMQHGANAVLRRKFAKVSGRAPTVASRPRTVYRLWDRSNHHHTPSNRGNNAKIIIIWIWQSLIWHPHNPLHLYVQIAPWQSLLCTYDTLTVPSYVHMTSS